jgi:carboxypeptidase T
VKAYIIIFLTFLLISDGFSQNYKQVKIFLKNIKDVEILNKNGLEFDHPHYTKDKSIEVFLNDSEFELLKSSGFRYEILIEDWYSYYNNLQKMNDEQQQQVIEESSVKFGVEGFHFGSMGGYMTLAEVNAELDTLKKLFPFLITTKQSLGNSIENRPVYMVKISDNPDIDEDEPEVLYTALHHAREPESMMQMFYFMHYLLENYNSNPAVQYLVNNRTMYFIPVVNPDGYEYNRLTNPNGGGMWRKNRRNNGSSYGIDLNRNYGPSIYWNAPNGGSSTTPSSETYRGSTPFSEPETQIIKNFLASRKIKNALNYHTYGNLLVYPYGALSFETPDSLIFREYASDMTKFNGYVCGTDMQTVGYSTRGNSDDYFYDGDTLANGGKIFAMTPEVGSSSDGFWPDQSRIFPLAQENLHPNLYYAWVAGEYVSLDNPNFAQSYFNPSDVVQFYPSIKNKGLTTGFNIHVELSSLSAYAVVNSGSINIDSIKSRNSVVADIPFSFTISKSAPAETEIKLLFTCSTFGTIMSQDTVSILVGYPEFVFSDSTNNPLTLWTITAIPSIPTWEAATSTFYSSPSCYTDSKTGNYANNATVTMALANPIDLSVHKNPKLIFWTKYDIEANWDYGQVEISTNNGNTWVPLAGKYSKFGTGSFQPNGQPLYDGVQSNWVREEISLNGFNSSQTKLRFTLRTDGEVQRDGWYVDDIAVVVYKTVPVELISFTGVTEENKVKLSWQTATELNNYGFQIERKSLTQTLSEGEGLSDWTKVGFVSGVGNSSSLKSYSFIDEVNEICGKYIYRLKQIDLDGSYKYSNEVEVQILPVKFSLEQNYPNPFNPTTKIRYAIPTPPLSSPLVKGRNEVWFVTLKVYDILGREVATLVNEEKPAGIYEIEFDPISISQHPASSVYFYRLQAGSFVETRKMILMR